jgi:O-antigen/teichoic acid export membrane protein
MTTTVPGQRPGGRAALGGSYPAGAGAGRHGDLPGRLRPPGRRRSFRAWLAGHPAWPVAALLIGWPAWWALGTADYMPIVLAIPMARTMWRWRASGRPIKTPPGFALWLLFLLVVVASISTISLTAPDTIFSPVSNRLIAYSVRGLQFAAVTVLLLYAGNLTETELPRRRLAWMLGLVAIYATVGGLGGVVAPHVSFTSPLAAVIPKHLQQNNLLQQVLHPSLAQVHDLTGELPGRPDAPFTYTNEWGNCLGLLLPWLLVGWWSYGTRRQRRIAVAVLIAVIVPIIYTVDRGLWLGLLAAIAYLAVRLAARGRIALLGVFVGGLALVTVLVAATPLQNIITQRLQHGYSDAARTSVSISAIQDAVSSPIVGYGDTRHQQGSVQSVAVGKSANCPQCGNVTIGGNGQLWLLLITTGFLGTAFYLGFFAFGAWRFRRDLSPYGLAGVLVLLLTFVFMVAYVAIGGPLVFTMLAYVMLWKNDRVSRAAEPRRVTARAHIAKPSGQPTALTVRPSNDRASGQHQHIPFAGRPLQMPRVAMTDASPTEVRRLHLQPADTQVNLQPAAPRSPAGGAGRARLAGVARGGALNMVGAVISAIATVATTVLVTRYFSKPVAGAFFTAMSMFLIVKTLAGLGANVGVVNFIARLRKLGQPAKIPAITRAAVIPVVLVSVVAAAGLFLGAEPLAKLALSGQLGHSGATPAKVTDELRALALALPMAALLNTIIGAARGYHDMRPTVVVDDLGRCVGQFLGVLAAVALGSAALIAPLWAVPYVPASIVAWLWLRRIRRRAEFRAAGETTATTAQPARGREFTMDQSGADHGAAASKRTDAEASRIGGAKALTMTASGFWRFTAPRALMSVAQIVIQRLDIILVAVLRGPAEAAVYTAATRFLVAGQFGNSAISMAAQPRFAELFAVGDRQAARVVYQVTTAWLILLTWPLYLLAIVYGPEILTLFGHSYRAGDTVMVTLGCAMLLVMGCGQVDMILVTSGRSNWSLANGMLAVVLNVSLDLFLIPRYGITGAAIGWAATFAVANLIPLIQIAVVMRLQPFGRASLIAVASTTVGFFVVPLAARTLLGTGGAVSAGAVAVGCAVLAIWVWLSRDTLQLSVMPGLSAVARIYRHRTIRGVKAGSGVTGQWPGPGR